MLFVEESRDGAAVGELFTKNFIGLRKVTYESFAKECLICRVSFGRDVDRVRYRGILRWNYGG